MPQKYLKLYEKHNDYKSGSRPDVPNVSHCETEDEVHYNGDWINEYLTFKILSDGTIGWKSNSANATVKTIQYSINNGTWTSITSSTTGVTFNVSKGDLVRFKGNNTGYGTSNSYYNSFNSTCRFSLRGNIMSLIGDNFASITSVSVAQAFAGLFRGCVNLIDAKDLALPIKVMTKAHTYLFLFYGCTNLISAPELPATTLYQSDYQGMFQNCTSLKEAPSLPVTSLSNYCYAEMFNGCTNLEKAPVLPAKTIQLYSYQNMFKNCSKLNYIRCEATDVSKTGCTTNWVSGVAATGTFVKDLTMQNWTTGVNGIPTEWTIKNNTPEYITANGEIETDFQLNSDNYKIVCSYYIPSIESSWKTIYYFNNGVYHQLLNNANKLGLYFVRHDSQNSRNKLVEQVQIINNAPSSEGANVVTYVEHPASLGYGVYCDYTVRLSSAENNYPYETWDTYLETKPSIRLTDTYTTTNSAVEIQNLKLLSSAPEGTRFYGIKVWSGNNNQLVFDGIPYKYQSKDAIYDKVSGHIYTTSS